MTHHNLASSASRGLQLVVRLYPWSVLWVLFALALILVVRGDWQVLLVVAVMVLVIAWHSIRQDHDKRGRRR